MHCTNNSVIQTEQLISLLNDLKSQPKENEWIEFKHNFHSPEEIGERISALSNAARIHNQTSGYLVFGIENETHQVLGTDFKAKSYKKENEELEHRLLQEMGVFIVNKVQLIKKHSQIQEKLLQNWQ